MRLFGRFLVGMMVMLVGGGLVAHSAWYVLYTDFPMTETKSFTLMALAIFGAIAFLCGCAIATPPKYAEPPKDSDEAEVEV